MEESNITMFPRICNLEYEQLHMMLPIEGYENARLRSLEEAIEPVCRLFPGDSLLINVSIVKQRCRNPADGLSQDESAAIMLYTCQWNQIKESLFFVLNATLRMEDRNAIKPWFPYLRLFIRALLKLPPINDFIYRGIRQNMSNQYISGTNQVWWGFSSCTDSLQLLETEQFCGRTGSRTIFHIKCLDARNLQKHSYYAQEKELLLLPGRFFKVRNSYTAADGLCMIQIDEVLPNYTLLKLPDESPWRRFVSGFNIIGTCKNAACQCYKKEVFIPIGFRKFDVLIDSNQSTNKCPMCGKFVELAKFGFNECQWRISGIKQRITTEAPIEFSENWVSTRGYSLNEHELSDFIWKQLVVEIKR